MGGGHSVAGFWVGEFEDAQPVVGGWVPASVVAVHPAGGGPEAGHFARSVVVAEGGSEVG